MRNPLTIFLVTHDATKLFVSSGFSSQQILMRRPAALVIETLHYSFIIGGERGIRTLDTGLPYTHFPGVLLQPLGHLSKILNSYQLIQFHSDQNGDRAVSLQPLTRHFLCLGATHTCLTASSKFVPDEFVGHLSKILNSYQLIQFTGFMLFIRFILRKQAVNVSPPLQL